MPREVSAETGIAQVSELAAIPETHVGPEVDLSSEWEQDFTVETPAGQDVSAAAVVGHDRPGRVVRQRRDGGRRADDLGRRKQSRRRAARYGHGLRKDRFAIANSAVAPGSPELAVLRLGVEASKQSVMPQPEMEVSIDENQTHDMAEVDEEVATSVQQQPWPQQRPVLQEMVSSIEQSLGDSFLGSQGEAAHVPAVPEISEPATPETTAVGAHEFRSGTLDDFVSDLEASLGTDFLPSTQPVREESAPITAASASAPITAASAMAPAANVPVHYEVAMAAAAVQSAHLTPSISPINTDGGTHYIETRPAASAVACGPDPVVGVDLSDMFGELKHELEEGNANADEDPETHYNLGVAFREMGLLDEAIGEFQKVCQAADRGHTFSQLMQTYTWLAQCFLDKGVPEAAVRWYERALKLPKLDAETRTALHYELASSFEHAGDQSAALTNFLEVYSNNIDYRDVAERIKALRT